MKNIEYGKILTQWKIYDESERWSIISLFRSSVRNQSSERFQRFLQNRFGKVAPDPHRHSKAQS